MITKRELNQKLISEGVFGSFNLIECARESCFPDKYTHWKGTAPYHAIHLVLNGNGWLRTDKGEFRLSAGDIFVLMPNINVEYAPDIKKPWTYLWANVVSDYASTLFRALGLQEKPYISIGRNSEAYREFNNMIAAYEQSGYLGLEALGHYYIMMGKLINRFYGSNSDFAPKSKVLVNTAIQFMRNNYFFPISIADVAANVCVHPNYLSSVFRQQTGMSPKAYLIELKMQRAVLLLVRQNALVSQVAKECGYKDALHFSREFKKFYNLSPTEYIYNYQNKK